MRCACCLRVLNPANAYTTRRERESADGLRWTEVANYGPVCAVRLGLTKPNQHNPVTRHKFKAGKAPAKAVVQDGQEQLFMEFV